MNKIYIIKLPPPFLFIICGILMYLIPETYTFYRCYYLVSFTLFLSFIIALTSIVQFFINKANISPINLETHILVTKGIYRLTRNPMYLSLTLTLIAWFLWLGNLLSIWGIILFVILIHYFQIKPEEKVLESIFGIKYLEYKKKVRRWI